MPSRETLTQQHHNMILPKHHHGLSAIPSPPRSCNKVVPVTAPRSSQIEIKVPKVTPEHQISLEQKAADRKHPPLLPKTSPLYRPSAHSRDNDPRYPSSAPPYPASAYPPNWYPAAPPQAHAPPAAAHPHPHSHPPPARYPQGTPSTKSTATRRTGRFNRTNQGESTLSALTERFIQLLDDYSANHGEGELDLNIAVQELSVQKRRLYDITNVLEGVGLIKKDRNQVAWADRSQLRSKSKVDEENDSHKASAMAALKAEIDSIKGHGEYIDNCIEKLSNNVREYTKCRKESSRDEGVKQEESNLFVTKRQIAALQSYHNDTVIAIRAPSGTSLEVPNPDEGMRPGVRRFQIFLTSPGPEVGQVKVMQVQNSNGTHAYQRPPPPNHYGYPPYPQWPHHPAPTPYGYPPPSHGAPTHPHPPSNPGHSIPVQQTKPNRALKPSETKSAEPKPMHMPAPGMKQEERSSPPKSQIGRNLPPRLPLPQLKRPLREMDRRASAADLTSSAKKRSSSAMAAPYPHIPPRPTLQRRASEPFCAENSPLAMPYPKVAKAPDGSRKPLKAALKHSPSRSPRVNIDVLPSPIKSKSTNNLQAPQSPCMKKSFDGFPCPSPIGRPHDLMAAPLHSPCFNESFLSSPIPTSRMSTNAARLSSFASPFPSFSPGIGNAQFSPFIASPSIARMEREMQGEKASPGGSRIPSFF